MKYKLNISGKSQVEVAELLNNFQRDLDNEKRFHDTLDNLMEGFQLIGFDWRYLYVNNAVVKQSRFSKEELLGKTMMERYPGIEDTDMFQTLSLCMKARIAKQLENKFTYADGSVSWFELSIQPTETGLVILSNDITDRKKAEQKEKDYTKELEDLIFMNSHNLRQPVTHILGVISLLNNCSNSPEELKKIADYLRESAIALDAHTKKITAHMHAMNLKVKE